jgi:hypothetical protein
MPDSAPDRYSAIARFELQVGDCRYPVSQVAPNFIIFSRPTDLSAGDATLVIDVEGEVTKRRIRLPAGASRHKTRVEIKRT